MRQISRIGLEGEARVLIHAGNVSSLDGLSSALLNINVAIFYFFSIVIFMQFLVSGGQRRAVSELQKISLSLTDRFINRIWKKISIFFTAVVFLIPKCHFLNH